MAWLSMARQGKARLSLVTVILYDIEARLGEARRGEARLGKAWHGSLAVSLKTAMRINDKKNTKKREAEQGKREKGMSVQQTSLLAYYDITRSGALAERTKQVFCALRNLGCASNSMIARASGIPINVVTPRMNEMAKKGWVVMVGKRPCRVTGSTVIYWRVA